MYYDWHRFALLVLQQEIQGFDTSIAQVIWQPAGWTKSRQAQQHSDNLQCYGISLGRTKGTAETDVG